MSGIRGNIRAFIRLITLLRGINYLELHSIIEVYAVFWAFTGLHIAIYKIKCAWCMAAMMASDIRSGP